MNSVKKSKKDSLEATYEGASNLLDLLIGRPQKTWSDRIRIHGYPWHILYSGIRDDN